MNDIIKIVQALEDSSILLKAITKTIENETKEQKGGFLLTLFGTLRASLLGHMTYVNRKRNFKGWLWKQRRKKNVKD